MNTSSSRDRNVRAVARVRRIAVAFFQASIVAIGLGVFLLVSGLPIVLIARAVHAATSWALGGWMSAPLGHAIITLVSVAGSLVATLLLYRSLFRFAARHFTGRAGRRVASGVARPSLASRPWALRVHPRPCRVS